MSSIISEDTLSKVLDKLSEAVPRSLEGRSDVLDAYGQMIKVIDDTLTIHRPWYIGIYRVDPINPLQIRTLPWRGPSEACSPIDLEKGGVIWTALRSGKTQYVPDVKILEQESTTAHVGCSSEMTGTEIVIPLFGPARGKTRKLLGAWDLDLNVKNVYGTEPAGINEYVHRLENILTNPGEAILSRLYQDKYPAKLLQARHLYAQHAA